MKFTYNQYNHESGYHRIPSKIHNFSHQHYKNGAMRMTMATSSTMTSRIYRKGFRIPSKKHPGKALPGKLHSLQRIGPGKITPGKRIPPRPYPPPCDNSNDSGLGFDQHIELQPQSSIAPRSLISSKSTLFNHDDDIPINSNDLFLSSPKSGISISSSSSSPQSSTLLSSSPNGRGQYSNLLQVNNRTKRRKVDSLVEINEDACSEDIFIQKIASSSALTAQSKVVSNVPRQVRAALKRQPAQSQNNIVTSSNGQVQLEIVSQPEQQHRARYQTEGSRGAVKDRSGNGFPIVRLVGYNKPAVLQVFIGTDVGKVAPHMFYQACKVSGKNSTPCNEKKVEGTMFIEIEFKPENDMTITCDCVGILKERNVDVEHRFPDHLAQKSKKKSTRCRMVFRTQLTNDEGSHLETLQACSNAIICTQPPGVPEVCKKSLESSPVEGGLELFIIGKNFLKDTFVVFKESVDPPQASLSNPWEMKVVPDKEYLQQTHLICVVPSYYNQTINKPVKVELFIISSGKKSETHSFMYTPSGTHTILSAASSTMSLHGVLSATKDGSMGPWANVSDSCIEPKLEMDDTMGMMPPPPTTTIPMGVRRSSASSTMLSDQISQLKTEIMDDNSSNSPADSLDRFPVTPTGENMVNNTVMDHSFHNVRDQNLNVLDMRNLPMLQNANFTTQQQMIQSGSETVDKFISNITANMPSNGEPSIADFVHAAAVAAAVSDQPVQVPMQMTQLITNLSSPQAESPTSLERARSNSMSNSSGSPQSSSNGFESTISHDIILNSNSAASLMINSATPTTSQQQGEHITTDIIMNSSVAPTVICPQTDPITLNQVAMATSILSDIAAGQNQDQVTTNLINNIISANASTQPQVVSTTDSAISVMMSLTESQSDQVSQILNNQPPVLSTNTLVNMLHQQPQLGSVPVPATNAGFLNPSLPTVQIAAINSLTTQESLMVPNNHPVVQQVGQQVPQEVSAMSAMSEQDLISYINPSAFDQV